MFGVVVFGVVVSGLVESGCVEPPAQPAGVLPAASGEQSALEPESGVDLVPGLVVELGLEVELEPDVEPESARRIVPVELP